jgi:sugar lactone lactonase YvrE
MGGDGLLNTRYPDSHIESLDKRFKGSVGTGAVERVATGFRWAEGPAYFSAGRYLIFSDIPNNRMIRLLEEDNHLSVFRTPSFNSNGNTFDREGRLLSCEHAGRPDAIDETRGYPKRALIPIRRLALSPRPSNLRGHAAVDRTTSN